MDRETRNRIQSATQQARTLLEQEYGEQLDGVFDIRLDGTIAEKRATLELYRLIEARLGLSIPEGTTVSEAREKTLRLGCQDE